MHVQVVLSRPNSDDDYMYIDSKRTMFELINKIYLGPVSSATTVEPRYKEVGYNKTLL